MKKVSLVLLAVGLLGVVQCAQAADVSSVNIVGFVKKSLPAGGTILTTCNFDPISGGTNTLSSVFGTNQLKKAANPGNPAFADRVMLWDPAQSKYQIWSQANNGVFYKNNAGEWNSMITGDPAIPAGSAMWITAGAGGTLKDIVFTGEVVDVTTQKVQIVSGPQLIAYPFTSDIALQDTDFANDGAAKNASNPGLADRVTVWLGNGYQVYALSANSTWYKANTGEWASQIPASNTLALAEGFWYTARPTSAIIANGWTEVKKY